MFYVIEEWFAIEKTFNFNRKMFTKNVNRFPDNKMDENTF